MGVPNTETFSLQNVVEEIGLTGGNRNLQACFSNAISGGFDSNYNQDSYAPANSLLRFRNYQHADIGDIRLLSFSVPQGNTVNLTVTVAQGAEFTIVDINNNLVAASLNKTLTHSFVGGSYSMMVFGEFYTSPQPEITFSKTGSDLMSIGFSNATTGIESLIFNGTGFSTVSVQTGFTASVARRNSFYDFRGHNCVTSTSVDSGYLALLNVFNGNANFTGVTLLTNSSDVLNSTVSSIYGQMNAKGWVINYQ